MLAPSSVFGVAGAHERPFVGDRSIMAHQAQLKNEGPRGQNIGWQAYSLRQMVQGNDTNALQLMCALCEGFAGGSSAKQPPSDTSQQSNGRRERSPPHRYLAGTESLER